MTFRSLLEFSWPFRLRLGVSVMLMLLQSGVTLSVPWVGGQLASTMLTETDLNIGTISVGLIFLFALKAGLQVVQGVVLSATSQQILAHL